MLRKGSSRGLYQVSKLRARDNFFMKTVLKSLCLFGLLAGGALALTPEEKLAKLSEAFAQGHIAEGEKWGYSMLQDGDARSIQLLLVYFDDIGYAPELQKALRIKAAEMNMEVGTHPTEGAPWRLYAVALDSAYAELSAQNDAAGIRELGLQLYRGRMLRSVMVLACFMWLLLWEMPGRSASWLLCTAMVPMCRRMPPVPST